MPIRNDPARAGALANNARAVKQEGYDAMPPVAKGDSHGRRLLLKAEVLDRVRVSYPTLWDWMKQGTFPRGIFVGAKVCWFEDEVDAFLNARRRQVFKSDEQTDAA